MSADRYRGIGPVPLVLVRTQASDGTARLAVAGEVDLATANQLIGAISEVLDDRGVSQLIVDLGQVTFLDSTGVSALVAGLRRGQANGVGFMVTDCRDTVRRVLEITGVYKALTSEDGY